MTNDAIQVITTLFEKVYELLTSFNIPGTTITPLGLIFGIFLFKMILNLFKLVFNLGYSSESELQTKAQQKQFFNDYSNHAQKRIGSSKK